VQCEEQDCTWALSVSARKYGKEIKYIEWNSLPHNHEDVEIDTATPVFKCKQYFNENKQNLINTGLSKDRILEKYFYPRKREFLICKDVMPCSKTLKFGIEKCLSGQLNKRAKLGVAKEREQRKKAQKQEAVKKEAMPARVQLGQKRSEPDMFSDFESEEEKVKERRRDTKLSHKTRASHKPWQPIISEPDSLQTFQAATRFTAMPPIQISPSDIDFEREKMMRASM